MIPEVLVDDAMRLAKKSLAASITDIHSSTGCNIVAIVAQLDEGRACTAMAIDPSLADDPHSEVALMRVALARIASLLVLHLGCERTLEIALDAVAKGARLADLAIAQEDASSS